MGLGVEKLKTFFKNASESARNGLAKTIEDVRPLAEAMDELREAGMNVHMESVPADTYNYFFKALEDTQRVKLLSVHEAHLHAENVIHPVVLYRHKSDNPNEILPLQMLLIPRDYRSLAGSMYDEQNFEVTLRANRFDVYHHTFPLNESYSIERFQYFLMLDMAHAQVFDAALGTPMDKQMKQGVQGAVHAGKLPLRKPENKTP